MPDYDVIILGAGAAGMMAAAVAGRRGRSVLVVDHARIPGEKIRISGGGRCNFTNLNATTKLGRERFLSSNPRFALSALSRYTPADFIALVDRYGITWHEKELGQLFCDGPAAQIVNMLTTELRQAGAALRLGSEVEAVEKTDDGFVVRLSNGPVSATSLVVATGGKSIPKMGASGFGYRLAEQFGVSVTETRPALVPLTFEPGALASLSPLSGIAVDAVVRHGKIGFAEPLLFTHRGLSGPSILQISSYWREGNPLDIDLMGGRDLVALLQQARTDTPRLAVQTVLAGLLPKKVVQLRLGDDAFPGMIGDMSDKHFRTIAERFCRWSVKPVGSEGYRTAEVTLGGVSTEALDAKTMEARAVPGLFFIGEVVDVTGWLGGYNFQWAWASAKAAGDAA